MVRMGCIPILPVNVTLSSGTFYLFDGHCDGQNGLHTHSAHQRNVCDGVAWCERAFIWSQFTSTCSLRCNICRRNIMLILPYPNCASLFLDMRYSTHYVTYICDQVQYMNSLRESVHIWFPIRNTHTYISGKMSLNGVNTHNQRLNDHKEQSLFRLYNTNTYFIGF